MFINTEMDKENMVHMYNGMLLSIEKNKIMPFAAMWMDMEFIILSEVGQTMQILYDIT